MHADATIPATDLKLISKKFSFNLDPGSLSSKSMGIVDEFSCLAPQNIAKEIVKNPDFIAICLCSSNDAEKELFLEKWNQTKWFFPDQKLIHDFIKEQALKTPNAQAILCKGEWISYAELNARANQLAHRLRSEGVKYNDLIAICMERSIELAIGLLAIEKAGGAYVPIDPSYPKERISRILSDAKPKAFLTEYSALKYFAEISTEIFCLDDPDIFDGWGRENLTSPN